ARSILLRRRCRDMWVSRPHFGRRQGWVSGRQSLGRCGMRHLLLAATMLVVALVVTFGTASVLQGVAVARSNAVQSEPFVTTEAARPVGKPASTKERVTSQFRDRIRSSATVSGL